MHLARRAYVLVLLSAVLAIIGIWSNEGEYAGLWRIPAALLLLEQGNHGCANLAPFHRYRTADWAAEKLGTRASRVKAP